MKIDPINARVGGRKLWLGCIWQFTPRTAKHFVFSPRIAAWRMIRAHKALKPASAQPPIKGGDVD